MSKVVMNFDVSFKLAVLVDPDIYDSFLKDIPEIRLAISEKYPQHAERASNGDINDLFGIAFGIAITEIVENESDKEQELKVVNMEVKSRG